MQPFQTELQSITSQLATMADSLSTLQEALQQLQTASVTVQPSTTGKAALAPFSAFLMVELTPYFGGAGAKAIVDRLNRCNLIKDYRFFIPIYKMAGEDLDKRQLLKLVSQI